MTDATREEFEAWVLRYATQRRYSYMHHILSRNPDSGDYNTTWVDSAWIGWQASRDPGFGLTEKQ